MASAIDLLKCPGQAVPSKRCLTVVPVISAVAFAYFIASSYMNLKSSNQDEINIISDENNGNVLGENRESNNEKKEIEENLI